MKIEEKKESHNCFWIIIWNENKNEQNKKREFVLEGISPIPTKNKNNFFNDLILKYIQKKRMLKICHRSGGDYTFKKYIVPLRY